MNRQPGCIAKGWHHCAGPINEHMHCLGSIHPAGQSTNDPRIDTVFDEMTELFDRDIEDDSKWL